MRSRTFKIEIQRFSCFFCLIVADLLKGKWDGKYIYARTRNWCNRKVTVQELKIQILVGIHVQCLLAPQLLPFGTALLSLLLETPSEMRFIELQGHGVCRNNKKESMGGHYASNKKRQPSLINCSFMLVFKQFKWSFIAGGKNKLALLISIDFQNTYDSSYSILIYISFSPSELKLGLYYSH